MVTLARPLAILAAAAVAAPAAAQMPTMMGQGAMMGPAPSSLVAPDAGIDPPPRLDSPASCLDGKAKAGPAPRVVRVMPAPGATVRPGSVVLSVTFDRPMACAANLHASHFPLPCPDGEGAVIISTDRRTLTTVCEVEAGSSYSMPIVDFVADGGARSERYDLVFTTSTDAPVRDARQAMALEKAGPAKR
jgi:hypothetical protein